nr:uncharacterized protein LOC111420275 [Onthophagus taurus]
MNDSVNRVKNRASLELHHRKAESARTAMKNDHQESQTPTSNMCTMAIDLEKVLSLPALTHCQMYYLRQLSCYNLCIHKADNNKGLMFLWHEGISGRGGNEIASCVLKGIKSNITHKKQFVIWSDNCCGQNKNKMIVFLWIYLVCNGYADEIQHKFVVSGHSYLSCDRDFAIIEKKRKKAKCEVPMDLCRVICNACDKNSFETTMMQEEDFFNFAKLAQLYLNTTQLEISKVVWIKVSKDNPGRVCTKKTFSDLEPWKITNVFKKNITKNHIVGMNLPQLEMATRLNNEKKADLKKMIPYLKEENKQFYRELTA